jgi:asparagine synthase (glutamine-hydrolysing)
VKLLNGIFAFVIYDPRDGDFFIARDHIGINPLYWGRDGEGNLFVSSEMKAMYDICPTVEIFPPGHYYKASEGKLVKWYKPAWAAEGFVPKGEADLDKLRQALEDAVKRQLMSDVPYGLLISGGVDSSIIAAIAAKHAEKRVETDERDRAWWPRMHSFSVGLPGAPDTKYAKKVADHIGSQHHEIVFTVQEALDAIPDVIYHLETFDVTTIRAGTPMYLMSRTIKAMGIKMILSGEGADEIFGGYLYFHKAPNPTEFHEELVRKISMLHLYDCLRANKAMCAWGVEARVPFLDPEFLDVAMGIDPKYKMIRAKARRAADGEVHPPQGLRRLDPRRDTLAPEGAVLRRRRLFLDRLDQGLRRQGDLRLGHGQRALPLPAEDAAQQGSLLVPHDLRGALQEPERRGPRPDGPSIACSTPTAIRWDSAWAAMADPSGRAIKGVHDHAN